MTSDATSDVTADFLAYLDAAPSPYHAVAETARRLDAAGYAGLDLAGEWPDGGRHYVTTGGALIAWDAPSGDPIRPLALIGAHTDSPNLRVKPRPDRSAFGFRQLSVEPYGGLLLNSWLDRDLGLSGRVVVSRDGGTAELLFRDDRPLLRIPQLAIHLDRDVNEKGLVLDRARHLTPVWGLGTTSEGDFAAYLAERVDVIPADVLAWDVMLHDVTSASLLGGERELIVSGRLDNLCSCYGAVQALTALAAPAPVASDSVPVIALFDHEEVGSETATGANGALLPNVVGRMIAARGGSDDDVRRALAASRCLSADMAHGTHPNYPERHDIDHPIRLGAGPVIKVNMAQRYATSATSAGELRRRCDDAGIPLQVYAHRNDLPCGSTIGPLTAAKLAVDVVDVGMAQLSMHSSREMMAAVDVDLMVQTFSAWLS